MSYTSRIRFYLIAVALLPPLLIMAVIYFHSVRQAENADRRQAAERLEQFEEFSSNLRTDVEQSIVSMARDEQVRRAALFIKAGRRAENGIDPRVHNLNFAELLDSASRVMASHHRPGLIGETLVLPVGDGPAPDSVFFETMEYDIDGSHPAFAGVVEVGAGFRLLAGYYLDDDFTQQASALLNADIRVIPTGDSTAVYAGLEPLTLFELDGSYRAVLAGDAAAGFHTVAVFSPSTQRPLFLSLLQLTGVVALVSIILAILLGIIITNRARREIDNLIEATDRVADGDFTTPVMAYDEGEFSKLADSFSDMMSRLTSAQTELATAQKIAAWQVVGRKIAHELKNPLTPIAISADDLRRSHRENLPEFDRILQETTGTIKSEVARLTKLLDEFVSFARMAAPEMRRVPLDGFLSSVEGLYRPEVDSGRLQLECSSSRDQLRLDPEAIHQALVNLIKNAFETGPETKVQVKLVDNCNAVYITVEDDGPGFPDKRLVDSFEPFASTKPNGTGLGLVIAYRIVHDHGGSLELYNRESGGAGVRITLPQ